MNAEKKRFSKPWWLRLGRWGVGIFILVLALLGMWKILAGAARDLAAQQFSLSQLHFGWLACAGLLYLLGTLPCVLYWHCVLRSLGQRPRPQETLRAYFVGGLGKYVPGKALVVVLRAACIKSARVNGVVAGVSVFIETLTMMASGGLVATAILDFLFLWPRPGGASEPWVLIIAALLTLACVAASFPPLIRPLVRVLQVHRASEHVTAALPGWNLRMMLAGWAINGVGWCLMGMSLWATLRALPETLVPPSVLVGQAPLLVAVTALSVLAGFASPLPAGFGVRDYVVMALVATTFGSGPAVLSGCLVRVAWLIAELLASCILYFGVPPPHD